MRRSAARWALMALCSAITAIGQPTALTLREAEAIALKNHPRLRAAEFQAEVAGFQARQTQSASLPQINGVGTASLADHGSRVGAGGLNAPDLFTRGAYGLSIQQLLYDSGRNRELTAGARAREQSRRESVRAQRAEILLRVRQTYFQALRAQRTREVAIQTRSNRELLLRQITALAQSSIRSILDVNFAEVAAAEAEILVARAENDQRIALVELSAALGLSEERAFTLADEPLPDAPPNVVDQLVQDAGSRRPELAALKRQVEAARHQYEADRLLNYPSVAATGVAGHIPAGDQRLRPRYAGVGINLNIPLLNGGFNEARREESRANLASAEAELRDFELRVSREVRVAFLDMQNARSQMDLTARYLDRSSRVLRLAQTRYEAGLGGIVELNQAELARTTAEIANANSRYEYQIRRAVLDFQTGLL